jgi:hypothetical protein
MIVYLLSRDNYLTHMIYSYLIRLQKDAKLIFHRKNIAWHVIENKWQSADLGWQAKAAKVWLNPQTSRSNIRDPEHQPGCCTKKTFLTEPFLKENVV